MGCVWAEVNLAVGVVVKHEVCEVGLATAGYLLGA